MVGHSASPSVPCRYINGTPLPPRARLSLQPLISIVRRTNSMVHPRSRFARREKVGEVGNRLKRFLNAAPSRVLAARDFAGSTSKQRRSPVLPIIARASNGWGDARNRSSLERYKPAPMAACRPCVQGANRPRELAISILESNQAIFQGQRGARHDRGVIAASIIASPNGDVWRFANG